MTAEGRFYAWFFGIVAVVLLVGTPILVRSSVIEDTRTNDLIAIFYALGVFAAGGLLCLGLLFWCIQRLGEELPITYNIGAFLAKLAVVIVLAAIAFCWFFAIIPMFAFLAAVLSQARKARRMGN